MMKAAVSGQRSAVSKRKAVSGQRFAISRKGELAEGQPGIAIRYPLSAIRSSIPHSRRKARRGISLLEVLISMFILLFGLLGVAAMFTVGVRNVGTAANHDRGSAVGQSAFNEIKARGLLNPNIWPTGTVMPIQFDPQATTTITGLNLVQATSTLPQASWQYVFRSHDDLATERPKNADLPAFQNFKDKDNNDLPERPYEGHYTWMFTAIREPWRTGNLQPGEPVRVSVAIFFRRNMAGEISRSATLSGGFGGGDITITGTQEQLGQIRHGDWMFVAGNIGRWYRVLASDTQNGSTRTFSIAGPDWPTSANGSTTVMLFDRVVAVYEKIMPLENNGSWSY